MCEVVNKHYQEYDIYIGRGSKWGNPYSHKEGTKALYRVKTVGDAIEAYKIIYGTKSVMASSLSMNCGDLMVSVSDVIVHRGPVTVIHLKQRSNGQYKSNVVY